MGTIARHAGAPFADGEVLAGADLEADFATIYAEFNGGIDSANIEDASITTAKLGASAITQDKMTSGAASASEAQLTDATGTVLTTSFQTIGTAITHVVGNPARHVIIMFSGMVVFTLTPILTLQLLKDGASILGAGIVDTYNIQSTGPDVIHRVYVDTAPTPGGTHTYTLQAKRASGTATLKHAAIVAFEPRS